MDLGEATDWIDARLAESGVVRTGDVEVTRERPWGTVAKAPTAPGTVWLKAPGPTTAFEVPLYDLLARICPERILEPLGVDRERGWVLLPDGGPSLGESTDGAERSEGLVAALVRYAQLQRDVEPHVDELLALGIADMRPSAIPERFDEAVGAAARYIDERGTGGDEASLDRVRAMRETVSGWAADLAGRPGAAGLDHNDLHPWNVLGDPSRPGTIRFYDWGDSVVAHPFACAALPLGMVEKDSLVRARDAYLAEFSDLGPHAELVGTLELACRCAKVARALTWDRAVRMGGAEVSEDLARAPLESLESLADEAWTSRT